MQRPHPARTRRSRLGAVVALLLAASALALVWVGVDQQRRRVCEREARTIDTVLSYDDRLGLRELTRNTEPHWGELRPRLEAVMREWAELRTRACMEDRVELERCLDRQKLELSELIDAWLAGDRSWATRDLDEIVHSPASCIDANR